MKNKKRILRLPLLLMVLFFLAFAISCEKDDDNGQENVPVLSTTEVTDITAYTATSGGNISDDRGTTVTARGVCWSKNENPTIQDKRTADSTGTGNFMSSITNLEANTTYYIRAYATNSEGTGYGNALTFTTKEECLGSSFTDTRDGKVYQTVIIGNQEWMMENLAFAPSVGNYWAYDNDDANVEIYGYLYDWHTALNACPAGWHLPSHEEWTELIDYLGDNAGGKLKATGTIEAGTGLWHEPNTGATNQTCFTALPGGNTSQNRFTVIGQNAIWWSATENDNNLAWCWRIGFTSSNAESYAPNKIIGLSVRCVKD